MDSSVNKVLSFIKSERLFSPDSRIIVAVSGGADSVMLLRVLVAEGFRCVAAHCNFHLRGDESDRDQKFVESLCAELSVPLELVHFQTEEYAERHRLSIEMAARELRYEWFEQIRLKHKADCIAVAHHADDVVETFLMNVVRGTGIHGLTGIKPVAGKIVRPLLCLYRSEIEEYMRQNSYAYVTDSTNLQQDYLRNKFRLSVIPLLQSVNPSVKSNILNDIKHLRDVEALYGSYVSQLCQSLTSDGADGGRAIDVAGLLATEAPSTLLFEFLSPSGFSFTQCDDMVESASNARVGRTWSSRTHTVFLDRGVFTIKPNDETDVPDIIITADDVRSSRTVGRLSFELMAASDVRFGKGNEVAYVDFAKVVFPLVLRKWRAGDSICPFGMKGRAKKVSDILIDAKIPLSRKDAVKVLADASGRILWVVGVRSDERFSLTEKTSEAIKISVSEE
ncbi:MAG: tRNA lysidine(34) synthetase TilS [Paludibacteraceae bacterium]|nr:tRNA lysidine(34) synthetase TilS [Paludibacteraceae bacterium]